MKASPLEWIAGGLGLICGVLILFDIAEIPAVAGMFVAAVLFFISKKQRQRQGMTITPTRQRYLLLAGTLAVAAVVTPFVMQPSVLTFPPKAAIIFWCLNVVVTGGLIAFFLWKAFRAGSEKP